MTWSQRPTKYLLDRKKCLSSRKWVAQELGSSRNLEVPMCSYLHYYNISEAMCLKQDMEADQKFRDKAVLARIFNCTSYFSHISTVAFKQVCRYRY